MPTRKALRSLHKAIRHQDLELARSIVADDLDLVNTPASAPPKKDDGQSPLQIALKCGQFDIAKMLIKNGADVCFIESSSISDWRRPVLHDAIMATIFRMRSAWATNGSAERFECGLNILNKMLKSGADPDCVDTYGNNCIHRAMLDLRQVLTSIPIEDSNASARDSVFDADAGTIIGILVEHGGDIRLATETRQSAIEESRGTYFEEILNQLG